MPTQAPPNALLYASFIEEAYSVYENNPNDINPSLAAYGDFLNGYTLMYNLQMKDFFIDEKPYAYYGFIARNIATNEVIVAIRGTADATEWWDDFHFSLIPFYQGWGKVEEGFYDIYKTLKLVVPSTGESVMLLSDTITNDSWLQGTPAATLTITGHSLGASLATLYAASWAYNSPTPLQNTAIYTYASPKVGDSSFADQYNHFVTTGYRIYNKPDIVPHFPLNPLYEAVGTGYEVDSWNKAARSIPCFHALTTYMYMLGANASILGKCALS
ncbi:lipase family protein [Chitinophaga skermanii]|nr:lipase family protein [Chitinophaga skermanii]